MHPIFVEPVLASKNSVDSRLPIIMFLLFKMFYLESKRQCTQRRHDVYDTSICPIQDFNVYDTNKLRKSKLPRYLQHNSNSWMIGQLQFSSSCHYKVNKNGEIYLFPLSISVRSSRTPSLADQGRDEVYFH